MTTTGALPSTARRRRQLTAEQRAGVALGAGVGAALVVTAAAMLVLDNSEGPLGWEHAEHWGALSALGLGALAAVGGFSLTWWVGRRSEVGLVVLLVVALALAWVLFPRQVDVSESWVPQPNPRWSCTGWTFSHYPPATYDASSTTYCIGLEHRIPDG